METTPSKSSLHEKFPQSGLVAYFCMEIAIRPEMPTYSGGLGVLAGDTLRSAADLGVPLAAFSLIHRKGYFQQHLGPNGAQTEEVQPWNPADYCTEEPARVTVAVEGRTVTVRAWRYDLAGQFGHVVPIFLLDTDLAENSAMGSRPDGSLVRRRYELPIAAGDCAGHGRRAHGTCAGPAHQRAPHE